MLETVEAVLAHISRDRWFFRAVVEVVGLIRLVIHPALVVTAVAVMAAITAAAQQAGLLTRAAVAVAQVKLEMLEAVGQVL